MDIKGYKAFDKNWVCRDKQYTCPGTFVEDGKLELGKHGMHFCKNLIDCYKYANNGEIHLAEVIAHGQVLEEGDRCCTDNLEIVRELSLQEISELTNYGQNCNGIGNVGCQNDGSWNTGYHNKGHYNTGRYNYGSENTGDNNYGNCNAGNNNKGQFNIGRYNIGNNNCGSYNQGDYNAGDYNTGCYNSGKYNDGGYNTGDCNNGNFNSGDWNLCNYSNGCFNTTEPTICLFNKPSQWTYSDWLKSKAKHILEGMCTRAITWVPYHEMTEEEKAAHPKGNFTLGYLKRVKDTCSPQEWWDNLPPEAKAEIRSIPNFDRVVFQNITGIDVEGAKSKNARV
jgi:hypothetical protein